jgi:Asp-tRNA(Asn)/Glu-tRNA(Gln) amidotransferase A subunit family amidase
MKLYRLPLHLVAEGARLGRHSSEALTRSYLDRIGAYDDRVRAFAWIDEARAIECARACDAARAAGEAPAPLHGVPIALKYIFDTRGLPTERGSAAFRGRVPDVSADLVLRLEAAGAFVLGKTVTAELAHMTPGATRNPWNLAHTPGGSSSGAAAAVAACLAPAAFGTQTNGSVIRPAAFCGTVGYKPTQGLLSNGGVLRFSPSLDQIGMFTRCVKDAALLLAAIAPDQQHATGGPPASGEAPRLAIVRTEMWERAAPEQRSNLEQVTETLRRTGASVDEQAQPAATAGAHEVHRTIMGFEAASEFTALQREHRSDLSPAFNAYLDWAHGIPRASYEAALAQAAGIRRSLHEFFAAHDAVLTVPAPGEAPADLTQTGDPSFCTLWTLGGLPAITLPSGFGPRGLPLGVQLVGARNGDAALLAVAHWCERALPALELPPLP